MSKNTAVDFNMYMREVCTWLMIDDSEKIGGKDCIVEIDESLFSKRKSNRGRVYPQVWVFGGICCETKKVFVVKVENRNSDTLMKCIENYVEPGTTIISDLWSAYKVLDKHPSYSHQTVNHSENFVDPTTGAHTNSVESMWRDAKSKNKKTHGTNGDMIDSYLAEFLFRKHVPLKNLDPFHEIMTAIGKFQHSILEQNKNL